MQKCEPRGYVSNPSQALCKITFGSSNGIADVAQAGHDETVERHSVRVNVVNETEQFDDVGMPRSDILKKSSLGRQRLMLIGAQLSAVREKNA